LGPLATESPYSGEQIENRRAAHLPGVRKGEVCTRCWTGTNLKERNH